MATLATSIARLPAPDATPPTMTYRVKAFYRILNEMVDVILEHETKTRGKEFTVKDLIAELEAQDPPPAAQPESRTRRRKRKTPTLERS